LFDRISKAVANNLPIDSADVATLRKNLVSLEDKNYNYAAGDVQTKFLTSFRRQLGDAFEEIPPSGSPLTQQLANARDAYRDSVALPRKVLRTVLSENTAPADAYNAVFGLGDNQRAYRAVYGLLQAGKGGFDGAVHDGIITKLRAGFMEKLLNAGDDNKAFEMFRSQRNALASTGLFSEDDLKSLQYVIQTKQLPQMVQKATNAIASRIQNVKVAGVAGLGAGMALNPMLHEMVTQHPAGTVALLVAGAGMGKMRKLLLAPGGSQAAAAIGGVLVKDAMQAAKSVRHVQHTGPTVDDTITDE
jgi:hypothetical protein